MSQDEPFEPELIAEGPAAPAAPPVASARPAPPRKWPIALKVGLIVLAAAGWLAFLFFLREYVLRPEPQEIRRKKQLLKEFGPRFEALTRKIARLVDSLPEQAATTPPPEFEVRHVVILSYHGIKDPEKSPDDRVLANPYGTEPEWSVVLHRWRPDDGFFKESLEELPTLYERILKTRHVLVLRITSWQEPSASLVAGKTEIRPGRATADAFLLDLEVDKVVASAALKADPLPLAEASHSAARAALRTALHQSARDWLTGRRRP